MAKLAQSDYLALADALGRRVLEGPGETPPELREAVAQRAAGGRPIAGACDDLARQIGESACRVTDAQVANVLSEMKSEKATFEIVIAASVGAGLLRCRQAIRALEAATDATS
jgi:hypothetical protein